MESAYPALPRDLVTQFEAVNTQFEAVHTFVMKSAARLAPERAEILKSVIGRLHIDLRTLQSIAFPVQTPEAAAQLHTLHRNLGALANMSAALSEYVDEAQGSATQASASAPTPPPARPRAPAPTPAPTSASPTPATPRAPVLSPCVDLAQRIFEIDSALGSLTSHGSQVPRTALLQLKHYTAGTGFEIATLQVSILAEFADECAVLTEPESNSARAADAQHALVMRELRLLRTLVRALHSRLDFALGMSA
jgi:hypothetical protein